MKIECLLSRSRLRCSSFLERPRKVESSAAAFVGDGGDGEVVFLGKGLGEQPAAGNADDGTGGNVPTIVLLGVAASPSHVAAEGGGGQAILPAVAVPKEGGTGEADGAVGGGESVMARTVGTVFLDAKLQQVVGGERCALGFGQLQEAFVVFLNKGNDEARGGGGETECVRAAGYAPTTVVLGGAEEREEEQ